MPLVYRLARPTIVSHVRAEGEVEGRLRVKPSDQGRSGFDDYALRLGIVEAGSRRLGRFERLTAPHWLRTLFDLAPPPTGIGRVRFLNVGVAPSQVGRARKHPMSDLLEERVVAAPDEQGYFHIDEPLAPPPTALGIWLSADGDDTGSCYSMLLHRLELTEPAP